MTLIEQLQNAFRANSNEKIALWQHAYMKAHFPFLGLQKPLRAKLQKTLFIEFPLRSEEELQDVLLKLWEFPEREFQYAALDLGKKYSRLITPKSFSIIELLVRTRSWWDTVDDLAANILGSLLLRHPDLRCKMEDWIDDPYLWIRRSALLYQLKYKAETDVEELLRFCQKRMEEKDFFIRKAIGWVLREYAKTDPSCVKKFIVEQESRLSALSIREASKHL
ncbi:MAG: DNA alkylation repair protein [Verrucomicrobia bacterium]|nr:DNA alkylation repair protein [Verrucomicrobiota bacterium]